MRRVFDGGAGVISAGREDKSRVRPPVLEGEEEGEELLEAGGDTVVLAMMEEYANIQKAEG